MDVNLNPHLTKKDIIEEISKTMGEIDSIDRELNTLFSERSELENRVSNLPNIKEEARTLESQSHNLASKLDKASLTAAEISSQVRELDFAQIRVEKVLKRVNLMLDLKETIKKVESLIDHNDYSSAARETYRLLHTKIATGPKDDKDGKNEQDSRADESKQESNESDVSDASDASDGSDANEKEQAGELSLRQVDEVSYEVLLDLESRLQQLIKEKCDTALEAKQLNTCMQFCILYPYIGMSQLGLEIYCKTACEETIGTLEQQALTLGSQSHENAILDHLSLVEGLIDTVFASIDDHAKVLHNEFGVGSMLVLIYYLYYRCIDLELPKIVKHYLEYNNVSRLTHSVKRWNDLESKRSMTSASGAQGLDERFGQKMHARMLDFFGIESKKLDQILDQIQHMCQEFFSFDNSVRELAKETLQDYQHFSSAADGPNTPSKNEAAAGLKQASVDTKYLADHPILTSSESGIVKMRHELISNYIVLEQLNMQMQIQQIMSEDAIISASDISAMSSFSGRTSNSSELVFYVLKKIAQRAFETYDINAACAVINHIYNCLDSDYKEWLDGLLRKEPGQGDQSYAEQFYKSARNLYSREMISPERSRKTVIILNNLDQSISNVKRLKLELEDEMNGETFQGVGEKEKFQLRNCLEMLSEVEKSMERVVERGIYRFAQSYNEFFKSVYIKFSDVNYDMTEKQFSQAGSNINVNDSATADGGVGGGAGGNKSFVGYLDDSMRPHLKALQMRMERNNFHRITTNILSYLLNEMERMLLNHKFTFWGAMQFDQDRQALQAFFNENTKAPTIREQFARLRQIATILQLTKLEEVINYVNDPDLIRNQQLTTNTLTNDEIKKFLSLRKEFDVKRIQSLQL